MSPMRLSLLLLTFVLAGRAESMECVPMWVSVSGAEFFGRADLVFYGRWDGDRDGNGVFRAEGVVRGHAEISGTYSPEVHPCNLLDNGRLYIVARWCGQGACSRIVWQDEGQFRRLLRFHENEHQETLESLMDRMIRWQAGGEPNASFRAWVDSAALPGRTMPCSGCFARCRSSHGTPGSSKPARARMKRRRIERSSRQSPRS
jgi:hypothetical protein